MGELRDLRAFKSSIGDRRVRETLFQFVRLRRSDLRGLDVWKHIFVSREMPNCFVVISVTSEYPQQRVSSLQLKHQKITCLKTLRHIF